MKTTEKFNELIGKKIYAYAWQRDNGGEICGIIESITFAYGFYTVNVNREDDKGDKSLPFSEDNLNTLLSNSELPTPNKFLNSGIYAKLN